MSRLGGGFAAALVVCVAAVCIRLGFWQLDRLEQRRTTNAAVRAGMALPPLRLDSAGIDSIRSSPERFAYRPATATGVYLPGNDFVLRGRTFQGQPGVHLVAALRTESGSLLLVNRGWLPSADAATVDPRPYRLDGPQQVSGLLMLVPSDSSGATPAQVVLPDTAFTTFYRLDRETVTVILGEQPEGMYLQVLPTDVAAGPSELPVPVDPPALDEGSHASYAFQWFSFAAIAVVGLSVVAIRSRRNPNPDS